MESKPIRVLLIEDNPADARLLQQALNDQKEAVFELTHVDHLSDGVKLLAEGGVDLVLVDLMLPDSQGLDSLRAVRKQDPKVPMVVLTASDDQEQALKALQSGAQDYLVKGYVQVYPNLLSRALRYAIERKREDQVKDELVNTVTHELRTPLATIREFVAILADATAGPLTPDQREYLTIISTNVDRMTRMVDNLLAMAKIEAGHAALNKAVVEVAPLLQELLQSMRPLASNKQLDLVLEVPTQVPDLFADVDKLAQILLNLVSNAIKCTPAPGRVTIRVVERTDEVEFDVTDTGVGISAEDLPKLFEKFQQVHTTFGGKERVKGTGLGLSISRQLVEVHGGRIWATSLPGRGSTFSFTLPKYHPDELFHEYFKAGIEQAKRKQRCFSVIVVSIPTFQEVKARYSTDEASQLLKDVEMVLRGVVRRQQGDAVIRWQRGEMVIVLAEINAEGAQAIAARIKRVTEKQLFTVASHVIKVPVIIATATYPEDGQTEQGLLALAERRLQRPERVTTRIMVVDDEIKIRQFLKEFLELHGYEICTVAGGPDALEQLSRQTVDLVLLDLKMPVMNGYELYHLLKENPRTKHIPIIIVTGQGERKDRELGLNGAAYNYILKPFQAEELLAKIREVLLQQQAVGS